jgi:two-component system sensor histidine kinase RegB
MLMLDVIALTVQLYLSGGATNPFISLYLLQVTLGAVLLDAWSTWAIVAVTCISFGGLTVLYRPLALPPQLYGNLFNLHIAGMLVCFALDAALIVVFMTRIARNLRERDARLAALKQHAAEEDHIVRMGLLASGAAHELGTPLSSLSVILSDWRRMPALTRDPDRLQEIDEMQAELQRCKSIVTGILLSAGEARGEAPGVTTVNKFLDELVQEWRVARSVKTLSYENRFGTDLAVVSDSALKHVIFNVLDNAFEASPLWVSLTAERDGDTLVLRVRDMGPGFAPQMLAQLGKPYHSSKGRLGGGLGVFLVVNAVRKLGGSVSAGNRPQGGAVVILNLPLAALAIGARDHAG